MVKNKCVVVAQDFNLSTQKSEALVYLWFQGKPALQIELQVNQGYIVIPCLQKH